MKLLRWTATLSVLALFVGVRAVFGADIYVVNQSSLLSDAQVQDALPAFQAAVDEDFMPYWNAPGKLIFAHDDVPALAWTLTVSDKTGVYGAAGYHTVGKGHVPIGVVGVDEGLSWQLVFTHELFEMLADPYIDRATFIAHCTILGCYSDSFYMLEVADPVETHWYTRPSASGAKVIISDFVTERWYDAQGGGKMDFMGLVKRHHQILKGGYAVVNRNNTWEFLNYKGQRANFFRKAVRRVVPR